MGIVFKLLSSACKKEVSDLLQDRRGDMRLCTRL